MRVLDLFSGLGGWSQAFKDRGHEVVTVDIEERFKPDIVADVMNLTTKDFEKYGQFDVILASPPCNCFSVMTISKNWKIEGGVPYPKRRETKDAMNLVKHTLNLIDGLNPRWWILENPRGMLRMQTFMKGYVRKTITQCQYGKKYMKPTDLWGVFPGSFIAKKCKNGASCHLKTRRSARHGIEDNRKTSEIWSLGGMKENVALSELRSMIPYGLSLAVCEACEKELKSNNDKK
jgi:hypothetical protein